MAKSLLSFTFILALLAPTIVYHASVAAKDPPLQQSMEGSNLAASTSSDENIEVLHSFPFTDPRMKTHQREYEQIINDFIIEDLDASKNVTEASEKYPQDSPVLLTIQNKFAFHLFIEENLVTLSTFNYDLSLDSCGVNPQNLRTVHTESKKGNIFDLHSVPNKKYKTIIENLISKSANYAYSREEQEIPLFITVHPSLTTLPAATIEDTLENIRLDFPKYRVKYCTACPNVLPYDEYAYLTWLSILNYDTTSDNRFFQPKDQLVINLGFTSDAVFVSYPIELVSKGSEDDKVVTHTYCLNKQVQINPFVQNAYYERSLDRFTKEFVSSRIEGNSKEDEIKFPCYPGYFDEKVHGVRVKGSGNFDQCKKDINTYMKEKAESQSWQDFGISNTDVIWPLDSLRESSVLHEAKIYVESEALESLLKVGLSDEKYSSIKFEDLSTKIKNNCTEFLGEEVKSIISSKKNIEYTNTCLHLIYIDSLLQKMGIKKEKELRIKMRSHGPETWIKGVTLRDLETFHSLEKEWFNAAQDRALETYLVRLKDAQELDKEKAMNFTMTLIVILSVTFWIGFIIRFRSQEAQVENVKLK